MKKRPMLFAFIFILIAMAFLAFGCSNPTKESAKIDKSEIVIEDQIM